MEPSRDQRNASHGNVELGAVVQGDATDGIGLVEKNVSRVQREAPGVGVGAGGNVAPQPEARDDGPSVARLDTRGPGAGAPFLRASGEGTGSGVRCADHPGVIEVGRSAEGRGNPPDVVDDALPDVPNRTSDADRERRAVALRDERVGRRRLADVRNGDDVAALAGQRVPREREGRTGPSCCGIVGRVETAFVGGDHVSGASRMRDRPGAEDLRVGARVDRHANADLRGEEGPFREAAATSDTAFRDPAQRAGRYAAQFDRIRRGARSRTPPGRVEDSRSEPEAFRQEVAADGVQHESPHFCRVVPVDIVSDGARRLKGRREIDEASRFAP